MANQYFLTCHTVTQSAPTMSPTYLIPPAHIPFKLYFLKHGKTPPLHKRTILLQSATQTASPYRTNQYKLGLRHHSPQVIGLVQLTVQTETGMFWQETGLLVLAVEVVQAYQL